MRKVKVGLAVLAGLGLAAQSAVAQAAARQFQFGPQVNFATNDFGLGVGARVVYSGLSQQLKVPGLAAYASFDYFFPSSSHFGGTGVTYWEINVNATYDVALSGLTGISPYAGAGIDYGHVGVSGCPAGYSCGSGYTGLNLLGGARFEVTPKLNAFAEGRIELRTGSAFVVTAGLLF